MSNTINDLGNGNIKELNRVFNVEISIPYDGKRNVILKKEKVLLVNNVAISRTQTEPVLKNYSDNANSTVTIYDPILRREVQVSLVGLVAAIQKFGE